MLLLWWPERVGFDVLLVCAVYFDASWKLWIVQQQQYWRVQMAHLSLL